MDINELEQLYEGLLGLIRDLGLGWVAEQVVEEVSIGKVSPADYKARRADIASKAPSLFGEVPADIEPSRRGPGGDVLVMEEYTLEDRLLLLLDAIEESVVHTSSMEVNLFEHLVPEGSNIQGIQFYSEVTDEMTMAIDRSRAQSVHISGGALKELLDQIRQEI